MYSGQVFRLWWSGTVRYCGSRSCGLLAIGPRGRNAGGMLRKKKAKMVLVVGPG